MVPRHLKDPLTMMASRVHRASHSSILGRAKTTWLEYTHTHTHPLSHIQPDNLHTPPYSHIQPDNLHTHIHTHTYNQTIYTHTSTLTHTTKQSTHTHPYSHIQPDNLHTFAQKSYSKFVCLIILIFKYIQIFMNNILTIKCLQ